MLEQTKNIELLAFILRLKKLYNCGYISFKEYWKLHVKHKTISLYKLEKLTSMLLEQGILIKGRKGYSMLNFNKQPRPATLMAELKQDINNMSQWRLKLHETYIRISNDPLYKGHPKREDVLELIQEGIYQLETNIKARRDMLAEIN